MSKSLSSALGGHRPKFSGSDRKDVPNVVRFKAGAVPDLLSTNIARDLHGKWPTPDADGNPLRSDNGPSSGERTRASHQSGQKTDRLSVSGPMARVSDPKRTSNGPKPRKGVSTIK